jgi:hypothetical protein
MTDVSKASVIDRLRENVERAMTAEPVLIGGEPTGEWTYQGMVANRALELLGKQLGRNFTDHPECKPIFDYCEAWDALASFPSRNAADIVEKLRPAEHYFKGCDTGELCDMLWADCRRLRAKPG